MLEKAPLLALSTVSAAVTLVTVAEATYLGKAIWPTGLAVFYPHPGASLAAWTVALSALVLAGLSLGASPVDSPGGRRCCSTSPRRDPSAFVRPGQRSPRALR